MNKRKLRRRRGFCAGTEMVEFGNRLRKLRLQRGLKQAQLAEQLGLTKSVVSAYETGLRMPSYEVLVKLARIFNVSTDFLLGVERRNDLDLSGLSEAEVAAVIQLIAAIKKS